MFTFTTPFDARKFIEIVEKFPEKSRSQKLEIFLREAKRRTYERKNLVTALVMSVFASAFIGGLVTMSLVIVPNPMRLFWISVSFCLPGVIGFNIFYPFPKVCVYLDSESENELRQFRELLELPHLPDDLFRSEGSFYNVLKTLADQVKYYEHALKGAEANQRDSSCTELRLDEARAEFSKHFMLMKACRLIGPTTEKKEFFS